MRLPSAPRSPLARPALTLLTLTLLATGWTFACGGDSPDTLPVDSISDGTSGPGADASDDGDLGTDAPHTADSSRADTDSGTDWDSSTDTTTSGSDNTGGTVDCPPEPHCPHDAYPDEDEDGCPICTPTGGEGEPCQEHMHCSPGLFCQQDECVPLDELGCEDHTECFGGVCALDLCAPRCESSGGPSGPCEDGRRCHEVITDDYEVGACLTPEQCADLGTQCGALLHGPLGVPTLDCQDGSEARAPGWMSYLEGVCYFPAPPVPVCDYFGHMIDVVVVEITSVDVHMEEPPAEAMCDPVDMPHLLLEGEVRASVLDELDGTVSFRFPLGETSHPQSGTSPNPLGGHSGWDPSYGWTEEDGLYWRLFRRSPADVGPLCVGGHILVALAPSRDASLPGVLTADPAVALARHDGEDWAITWAPYTGCFTSRLPLLHVGSSFSDYRDRAEGCENDPRDADLQRTLCP